MARATVSDHETNVADSANAHIEGEKPENCRARMIVHESHAPTQEEKHDGQTSVFDGNNFGLDRALATAAIRIRRLKAIVVVRHSLEYA